ncbi:sulfur carrier protein ThiS [bacterium]|nr:sulfur carrier protein ThiS [bacterium]
MSGTITVNRETMEWRPGMTVADILEERRYTFKMLVIRVNGTLIKKDRWPDAAVPEGADVQVLHLMSGG